MAQTVNATCRNCGPIHVLSSDMILKVFDNTKDQDYCVFTCRTCGDQTSCPVNDDLVARLIAIHVPVQRIRIPLEALELHPGGQQFTDDDVLDMMLEIDTWTGETS